MRPRIYKAGWSLLDIIFPPNCAGCGKWGEKYCAECLDNTRIIKPPICEICGEPLGSSRKNLCDKCRNDGSGITAVRSWAFFEGPLQSAIHKLKYKQDVGLGGVLANPLIAMMSEYHWRIDMVVPVPLDKLRKKERGYNQSALLAKPLCWHTGLPYHPESVSRVKHTRQQVGLSRLERIENMKGAFKADPKIVGGKSVLLIDDVITTGATIKACASALLRAGASAAYGLTLARSAHL